MNINIIGDQGQRKYDEDLASQVNAEIEAEERRKKLEEKRARLQTESQTIEKPTEIQESQPNREPKTRQEKEIELSNYIILPGRNNGPYSYPDFLIAKEISKYNLEWNIAQEELIREGSLMLTIKQFTDYLTLLNFGEPYDGTGRKLSKTEVANLFNQIMKKRVPQSEWLDAQFRRDEADLLISYWGITRKGSLLYTSERLDSKTLAEERIGTNGIDLNFWLTNKTVQGLPIASSPSGSVGYLPPKYSTTKTETVAFFKSNFNNKSFWGLNCTAKPNDYKDNSLGVRVAKLRK